MSLSKRMVELTIREENDYTVILRESFGKHGEKDGGCLFWVFSHTKTDILLSGNYENEMVINCNNFKLYDIKQIEEYKLLLQKIMETADKFNTDVNFLGFLRRGSSNLIQDEETED